MISRTDADADYGAAFGRAVDYAIDRSNRIAAVLIAGDLFDRPCPPADVYNLALSEFRRLKGSGIPVILIPGNHDALGYPHSVYADAASDIRQLVHFISLPQPGPYGIAATAGEQGAFLRHGMGFLPLARPF